MTRSVLIAIGTALAAFLTGVFAGIGFMLAWTNQPTELDHCSVEDQTTPSCYWDSQRHDPNDKGQDFISLSDGSFIVVELTGKDTVKAAGHTYQLNR